MNRRLSSEEFLTLAKEILQDGPKIRYQNPDAWIIHFVLREMKQLKNKKSEDHARVRPTRR